MNFSKGVQRYKNYLSSASSSLDYGFGYDLYEAPSDMQLQTGNFNGYKNLFEQLTQLDHNLDMNAKLTLFLIKPTKT